MEAFATHVEQELLEVHVKQLEWQVWQFLGVPKNFGAQIQALNIKTSFAPQDKQFELNSPLQVVHVEWQSWQIPLEFMK